MPEKSISNFKKNKMSSPSSDSEDNDPHQKKDHFDKNDEPNDDKIESLVIGIIAAISFLLLSVPEVDSWFQKCIPDDALKLITKALIIFVIVYISNRLMEIYLPKENRK